MLLHVRRHNQDSKRVSYGFSDTDYDFSLNRNGLLYATHPTT